MHGGAIIQVPGQLTRPPNAGFSQTRWRMAGGARLPPNILPCVCPVIRYRTRADREREAMWWANAVHFREARLGASGCGGADAIPLDGP